MALIESDLDFWNGLKFTVRLAKIGYFTGANEQAPVD
jgi:hypothetical protein